MEVDQEILNWQFHGLSLAGIHTAISIPSLSVCFDVAQGHSFMLNINHFFISHGHLDHAAGIPYIISQKALNKQTPPRFYMPASLVAPMELIMQTWQKIGNHTYQYELIPMGMGDRAVINRHYFVKSFKTMHGIDSQGYTVFESRKSLDAKYRQCPGEEIAKLKRQGVQTDVITDLPLISFTGDTQIDFLDLSPQVKKSKILIMEATYLDARRSVEHARKWGHTHLDEILARLPEIESERIVLIHVSGRYQKYQIEAILADRLSEAEKQRVVLFAGR